ncbi:hypothetical protein HYALB_00000540 [Hymenoscyphus albidus]|uniref:N-acetyltransferase domain-containing protein n=1 Tax=Hymenoscyphus albidus TaxID=595503 RepID=A0A9N9M0T0_9HELO|nr:hypothetical protein HYALB_00000540 [Hymenoscyphus albidus]
MKVNETVAVSTSRILLVPYEASHVTTYHEWMQDEKIQEYTASEPLSLPEEYAMQANWRTSHDKLTFIACQPLSATASINIQGGVDDVPERMLGDVNLFISQEDDDSDGDATSPKGLVGELELMIAPTDKRRQGYGRAAILAFMCYIARNIDNIVSEYSANEATKITKAEGVSPLRLRVKIGKENEPSLRLFESLGFRKVAEEPNYFGELELCLGGSSDGKSWVDGFLEGLGYEGYAEVDYLPDNWSMSMS